MSDATASSSIIPYQEEPPGDTPLAIALPKPRVQIDIRPADTADLPFIDDLQRKHSRMVGWFPTKQLETNIAQGKILVADSGSLRVGYCISSDRYFKRDDCGIIYQLNVAPNQWRGLIGASLVKTVFDRAAYGCRLFCCWCAQDLEANHFWESIGFVPLAFRTGSRRAGSKKEPRTHIFWQRRIREGDTETPYWFPSETTGGAVRENRIALPIPPGTHWSDAKPAVLPGMEQMQGESEVGDQTSEISGQRSGVGGELTSDLCPLTSAKPMRRAKRTSKTKDKDSAVAKRPSGGLWFAPPEPSAEEKQAARKVKKKTKTPKMKNDPKWVAAARELRDRYIDEINAGRLLPPSASGKYDVSRALEAAPSAMKMELQRLDSDHDQGSERLLLEAG